MGILKVQGTIELRVPDDISTYEALQKLEEFLDSAEDQLLGDTNFKILDYFAARIDSKDGIQRTGLYSKWLEEVSDEQE